MFVVGRSCISVPKLSKKLLYIVSSTAALVYLPFSAKRRDISECLVIKDLPILEQANCSEKSLLGVLICLDVMQSTGMPNYSRATMH